MNKKGKRQIMKLKEITPKAYLCAWSACPAMYEVVGKDKLVIVGSKVNPKKLGIAKKVGKNEQVVMIDKEMLKQIFEK